MSACNDRDNGKPNVAVVGRFQIGKSTLINCLLDDRVARTGEGISTTKISTIYTYGQIPAIEVARTWKKGDLVVWEATDHRLRDFLNPDAQWKYISATRISLWKPLLQQVNLIDTPGIDADADDTAQAVASLDKADFVIVLVENKGLCEAERRLFVDIRRRNLPFAVLVNCRDMNGKRWLPKHNGEIVRALSAELSNLGYLPIVISGKSGVWPCNLRLFWHASEHIYEDENAQEVCGDIERYIKRHLSGKKATAALTFEHSNFREVRHFFENNHWIRVNDGEKRNTSLIIANPKTEEFIQTFWDDQTFFAPFLDDILCACWFFATDMYYPYRELSSRFAAAVDGSDGNAFQKWMTDLARIIESHTLSEKFDWSLRAARAMTDWLEVGVEHLLDPYLAFCTLDERSAYIERFHKYVNGFDKDAKMHEISVALFPLRGEYENLASQWNALRTHASGVRNYSKSGFFGKIFTDTQQTPTVFKGNAERVFDAMTRIQEEGDRLLQPMIDALQSYWNGALELLTDIFPELANHGHDLSRLSYNTRESVHSIPSINETAFHKAGSKLLGDVMDAPDVPDEEKTRLYCLCRRIGIR